MKLATAAGRAGLRVRAAGCRKRVFCRGYEAQKKNPATVNNERRQSVAGLKLTLYTYQVTSSICAYYVLRKTTVQQYVIGFRYNDADIGNAHGTGFQPLLSTLNM